MSKTKEVNVYVDYLARCEGESALELRVDADGKVRKWEVNLYEPPRFFEGFLVGRKWYDAYETTSRICGICSVPHTISGIEATEQAFDIEPDDTVKLIRRLANLSELNMNSIVTNFILGGPDYFGKNSVMEMAQVPELLPAVKAALKFKRLGNDLTDFCTGRETHPIAMDVGRMMTMPDRKKIPELLERLEEAKDFAWTMAEIVAGYKPVVPFKRKVDLVAIHDEKQYAVNYGKIKSTSGFEIKPRQHDEYIQHKHYKQSNALHYFLENDPEKTFMCGPIARVVLGWAQLTPDCRKMAEKHWGGPDWFHENMPFSIYGAHCVEYLYTVEEAIRILKELQNRNLRNRFVEKAKPKAGQGWADTEAPRGLLHYSFKFDENGDVEWADIVTPTAHHVRNLEKDLGALGKHLVGLDDEQASLMVQQVARCYDLCNSCSVHFIDMTDK
ncbi:MAG: nickel-dependent hydrogenase large subunit [Vulcanimicrobiota bacterium]